MKGIIILLVGGLLICMYSRATAQTGKVTKYENIVYGNVSGMSLLMDVYQPEKSNRLGIVYIVGSGFGMVDYYLEEYNQPGLKDDYNLDTAHAGKIVRSLIGKGYTVFMINHRLAPVYHYPEIFYDCQRAVRYIRHNAHKYGINPGKLGAMGHSAGGHLSTMLGVRDTVIKNNNPIDRHSSKVQAVVSLAGPMIMTDFNAKGDTNVFNNFSLRAIIAYVGEWPRIDYGTNEFKLQGKWLEASPGTYITPDDAPVLFCTSENDPIVPARQSWKVHEQLKRNGVNTKILIDRRPTHEAMPDMNEVDTWFTTWLKH
jgi:acetyl esterase/lipase